MGLLPTHPFKEVARLELLDTQVFFGYFSVGPVGDFLDMSVCFSEVIPSYPVEHIRFVLFSLLFFVASRLEKKRVIDTG